MWFLRTASLLAICLLLLVPRLSVAGEALSADPAVATVVDLQGRARVRPLGGQRWTPLAREARLLVGDLIDAPVRGANALQMQLAAGGQVVMGPGTMVEIQRGGVLHLLRGELELLPVGEPGIAATGAGGFSTVTSERTILQATDALTAVLESAPRWLDGYHASTSDEWLGSLVAKVDGRNVPLTVGFHSVHVDIRDQIARTVIEESFVNHESRQLEGIFYFPLPADASISGFGMWVGGELVEAEIVEKQRAREIYETILRERRDPGLLEWEGGNLFKARVFPIPAGGEKRIKISYTQVLPLESGSYRYRYALRSELLRQHPLRQLDIRVRVDSAVPLAAVTCPSHETLVSVSDHSALVELSQSEVTPHRDLEVVVTPRLEAAPLVVIPHRRGDDGYFMLLLTPPDTSGAWKRELIPDGDPLDLVLLVDTSGSIDSAQRLVQQEFVAALLESLGEGDRVRMLTVDVSAQWLQREPVPADTEHREGILSALAARHSLGWSDLPQGFRALAGELSPGTQVVYLGDGIQTAVTAENTFADPAELLAELGRATADSQAAFHAVALGSTYEQSVLDGISHLGSGGTAREITGSAAATARQLLAEITQPALREITLEFPGLRVARVYPARLPNVASGRQLVVLGRYLPTGVAQTGSVLATGQVSGKPVRFSAELTLADGEEGNSFLPRLWARHHIEALLAGGHTPEVRGEVIDYSAEFGIMTPFTSFLVLENDADRERFGVDRRVKMSDGERFFADGAQRARRALAQTHMLASKGWREELRARMLRELAGLDRDPGRIGVWTGVTSQTFAGTAVDYSEAGGAGNEGPGSLAHVTPDDYDREPNPRQDEQEGETAESVLLPELGSASDTTSSTAAAPVARSAQDKRGRRAYAGGVSTRVGEGGPRLALRDPEGLGQSARQWWIDQCLPVQPPPPAAEPQPAPEAWPEELRAVAATLPRRDELAALVGGLSAEEGTEEFDSRTGAVSSWARIRAVVGAGNWWQSASGEGLQTIDNWSANGERGVFPRVFGLGARRAATERDARDYPQVFLRNSGTHLVESFRDLEATSERQAEDRLLVTFTMKPGTVATSTTSLVIDTRRRVLISSEQRVDGKITGSTTWSEFFELCGRFWAARSESFDGGGRLVSRSNIVLTQLSSEEVTAQLKSALALPHGESALLLDSELPSLNDARQAVLAGSGTARFAAHLAIALHHAASSQSNRALPEWEQAARLIPGKSVIPWMRAALLKQLRRQEELREVLQSLAAASLALTPGDDQFAATVLIGHASYTLHVDELLALMTQLEPISHRGPVAATRALIHRRQLAYWHGCARHFDVAVALREAIARDHPNDVRAVLELAKAHEDLGDHERSAGILTEALQHSGTWTVMERSDLHGQLSWLHLGMGDVARALPALQAWIEDESDQPTPHTRMPHEPLLSGLLQAGLQAEFETLVGQWLQLAQKTGELSEVERLRLVAAIRAALGNTSWQGRAGLEPGWVAPLERAARALLSRVDADVALARLILQDAGFRKHDLGAALIAELPGVILADGAGTSLVRLQTLMERVDWNATSMTDDVAKSVAGVLELRWVALAGGEQPEADRLRDSDLVAALLLRLFDARNEIDTAIAFSRERLDAAGEGNRHVCAVELYRRLLVRPWTQAIEDELWGLVSCSQAPLPDGETPEIERARGVAQAQRLFARIQVVQELADRLPTMRAAAAAEGDPERAGRTRAEVRELELAELRAGWRAVAARIRLEAERAESDLRPWLLLEAIGLAIRLEDDPRVLEAETREILGALPPPPVRGAEPLRLAAGHALDPWMRSRCLTVLAHLATTEPAVPELIQHLLDQLRAGIAAECGELDWRMQLVRLLVALDRREEVEAALRSFVTAEDADTRWRRWLAYVLAETGQLSEAIAQLQQVERVDLLAPDDYRRLGEWALAAGDLREHERALQRRADTTPAATLRNLLQDWLEREYEPRGDRPPPELDVDILRQFRALLSRSKNPGDQVGLLSRYYGATRDFRLLECVPDGVLGHSAGGVYTFLTKLAPLLDGSDEPTCDELRSRLLTLRSATGRTPADLRALLLLECQVERRAARVLNQPSQHAERALAALVAANDGNWQVGEPRLYAEFLAGLGEMPEAELAREQLRQMAAMTRLAPSGSLDRLETARLQAQLLLSYRQAAAGADLLGAELEEYRRANGGALSSLANPAIATLVTCLENSARSTAAETLLEAERAQPAPAAQRQWYMIQILQLYQRAIASSRRLSFGEGAALYEGARDRARAELEAAPPTNVQLDLAQALCNIHAAEHDRTELHGSATASGKDLASYASTRSLEFAHRRYSQQQDSSMISTLVDALDHCAGPEAALSFLVLAIETEPSWITMSGQGIWRLHAGHLGDLLARGGAPVGSDIEKRLLTLCVLFLHEQLAALGSTAGTLVGRGRFSWKEQVDAFARVAALVLQENPQSEAIARHVAVYLDAELDRTDLAIDVLLQAYAAGHLGDDGQAQLCNCLHRQGRHPESLDLLRGLVQRVPDSVGHRVMLMTACFKSGLTDELATVQAGALTYFRDAKRWSEDALVALAKGTLACELYDRAIVLYRELIPKHQQSRRERAAADGTLSTYYTQLAEAESGLGHTLAAVEAATAAVVSWGAGSVNRRHAIESMTQVLSRAKDLLEYAASCDERALATGLDSPLIRKSLGSALLAADEAQLAAHHLEAAIALAADDPESYRLLTAAYDSLGDTARAADAVRRAVMASPRDLELALQLAQRLATAGDVLEAERALTGIIEGLPNEGESHSAVARARERAGDLPAAIREWKNVARLREFDPTGLLELARVLTQADQKGEVPAVLSTLEARSWPSRFGSVAPRVRTLRDALHREDR